MVDGHGLDIGREPRGSGTRGQCGVALMMSAMIPCSRIAVTRRVSWRLLEFLACRGSKWKVVCEMARILFALLAADAVSVTVQVVDVGTRDVDPPVYAGPFPLPPAQS